MFCWRLSSLRRKRGVGEQKQMAAQNEGEIVEVIVVAATAVVAADGSMIGSRYGTRKGWRYSNLGGLVVPYSSLG